MHPRPAAAFADEADGPLISVGSTWDGTFAKLNHHELPTAPPATPPAVCITQEGGDVLWIPPGWLHSVDTIQEGPLTDLSSVSVASYGKDNNQTKLPPLTAIADQLLMARRLYTHMLREGVKANDEVLLVPAGAWVVSVQRIRVGC